MRERDEALENELFDIFKEYYDLEKDANAQHDPDNYSLNRMVPLAEAAGHPEHQLRFIHIAGTKGKGSTCYFIAALLNAAGRRCGIFTSPHVVTVRERFQIDGEPIDYKTLIDAATALRDKIRAARLTPSLFEIFTVLALKLFADAKVDFAVMETGIGGRLDATNFIDDKLLAVITPISYDHIALLGNDIQSIAREKAGIIRNCGAVIMSKQPYAEAAEVIKATARQNNVSCIDVDTIPLDINAWELPKSLPPFELDNFKTAVTAIVTLLRSHILNRAPAADEFRMPKLRARFELLRENPPVIIDAAHNGDSAKRLAEAIRHAYPDQEFICVLGCLAGKDIRNIVKGLSTMNAKFILTNPKTPRKSALAQLQDECKTAGLDVLDVIDDITDRRQLPQDRPLLFTGSFFTATIGDELFGE